VIVDYIDAHRDRFGVAPICAVLSQHGTSIAPSTYYATIGHRVSVAELDDAYRANELFDLHRENRGVYGRRKLWHAARRAGITAGRDQVERLMRMLGIAGAVRGAHTTITTRRSGEAKTRHPDLVQRDWDGPQRPDQWWVADFTYVWTPAGFCYVSFVTDVFSRRILGWRVSTSKTTPLVTSALEQALFTRRRTNVEFTATGLLHHSDAGSQYTSLAFTDALREAGLTGSIGTVGDALDNALMESTIGLFKTEVIEHERSVWASWRQVEQATASWVHWYNHERLHSSIGDIPPVEFEELNYALPQGHDEPAAA
jgi:putative transposase